MKFQYDLESIELKNKMMQEQIENLKHSFAGLNNIALKEEGIEQLSRIELQYNKMYQAMAEGQQYEKYEQIEQAIAPYLMKLDIQVDPEKYV